MKKLEFPQGRMDCLSRELGAEVLIYDLQRDVGHCLNSTAAAVWRLCDGKRTPRQIAAELSRQFSTPVGEQIVRLALGQLGDAHLLVEREVPVECPSRRVVMQRIGIAAAIALPLITSMAAPTPAQAASCLHNLARCTSNSQCCSNVCSPVLKICIGG